MDRETIRVRRQWDDHRIATFRSADLQGLHWSDVSGGMGSPAPREFLSGYVLCTEKLDGDLAHDCGHGPPPHRIKVCIVRKDNPKAAYERLLHRARWEDRLKGCPWLVAAPAVGPVLSGRAAEILQWLDAHWPEDGYVRLAVTDGDPAPVGIGPQIWFSGPMPARAFAAAWGWRFKGHQNQAKQRRLALLLARATR